MKTEVIFLERKHRDDEKYIFLDLLDNGEYQVRIGSSKAVDQFTFDENETVMSLEEFLAGNDKYAEKVDELKIKLRV